MIHELDEQFDDRNMFLLALLGLLSVRTALGALIESHGHPAPAGSVSAPEARARDHFLHALLGVMSTGETVAGHAAGAMRPTPVDVPKPPPSAPLRRLLV